ncbi:C45 family peptidase [Nitratireductor sp. ZSWI3]|uniref:C45 family autoproteolytic acyltransferase/hydolase n=1 Tax=Nitratireductor sp. ZSWI3 TaxID=2966359 RepID=UPI00214FDA85|nr:C45 family peptidase [Nitratireductor sp. ZSWI3]MCR4266345.1 C45 family peptidase [Nitratireductor sp. ZSWI3]
MFTETRPRLSFIEIEGTPREVGLALGRHGAAIVNGYLTRSHAWASVMAFRHDPRIAEARALVETLYPRYWQELHGLAEGLGLPFDDVFTWNCRGDVWAMAPDGCTTIQLPGRTSVLGHNEDGDPRLAAHCVLASVRAAGGRPFVAFVYPCSLPGHTFAANEAGLVQTVNNIRSRRTGGGLPRMVLTRAVLDCADIDEAVGTIAGAKRAGAFHSTLAQAGDGRLVSVEFTHSACSVLTVSEPQCHANHLVHAGTASEAQIVTASSRARQERGEEIVGAATGEPQAPLSLLWDTKRPDLPIYRRQPDDPDHENTLATAVFEVGADKLRWRVYDGCGQAPRHAFDGLVRLDMAASG